MVVKLKKRSLLSQEQRNHVGKNTLKVLFFSSPTHIQGGAEQSLFRMARWLKRQGGEPIVVLQHKKGIFDWYAKEGINVRAIPFVGMHRRSSRSPFYLIQYILSTIGIIVKLVALIKQQRVDVVHVNEITYFPGLIAGKIAGAKTICHVRIILERPAWLRRTLSWLVLRFSDQILCVSDAVRAKMFPPGASHVHRLYNPGPDLDRFDPQLVGDSVSIRQELDIASDAFVVGLVSKFIKEKGHLAIVEAARLIEEQMQNSGVIYLIVGGEMPGHESYFAEVCHMLKQYGLVDSFILAGVRTDVPQLIAACDVMVHLPLNEDPLPNVVFEALAMKKPIVAFASGGVSEQFENGKSGILIQKNDIEAVVDTLMTLVKDRVACRTIGEAGRCYLTSHFSAEKFYPELMRIYNDLLGRPLVTVQK